MGHNCIVNHFYLAWYLYLIFVSKFDIWSNMITETKIASTLFKDDEFYYERGNTVMLETF